MITKVQVTKSLNLNRNLKGTKSAGTNLCLQGNAINGMLGLPRQMGQEFSSAVESEDLSLEKERNKFLNDEEFKSGRSNNSISCMKMENRSISHKEVNFEHINE